MFPHRPRHAICCLSRGPSFGLFPRHRWYSQRKNGTTPYACERFLVSGFGTPNMHQALQPRYDDTKVPPAARPAKRARRKGAGSTGGGEPVMSAAIIPPTAGASLKPCPDIPVAIQKPARGDSSRMGIQSGVMSKAPAQPRE